MKEFLKKILPAAVYMSLRGIALAMAEQARLFPPWAGRSWVRILNFLSGGLPLPPGELVFLVAGAKDLRWFIRSGKLGQQALLDILAKNGRPLATMENILDFGCGVGRVIRHFHRFRGPRFHGVDYNPLLINWCRRRLSHAEFSTNEAQQKLLCADNTFDLVYALSIFTHLPEDRQFFWVAELSRILKPGGFLFITVHGEYHLKGFPDEAREKFSQGEMSVFGADVAGTNMCNTFHPYQYMKIKFAPHMELMDFIKEGALGNPRQDVYLFRKKAR